MRNILAAGVLIFSAQAAAAADKPAIAPAPAWVRPVALPTIPPADANGAPVRILLHDQQVALERGRQTTYQQVAMRIQNPQGLSAAGNVTFPWRPETDAVTVHKLLIRRGKEVIDVLASGQTFTVVRREANLESAMLDGVLTATIQPEGLQVGDILDFAASVTSADPTLRGHVEQLGGAWNMVPIERAHLRVQWPSALAVRFRQTEGLPRIKTTAKDGTTSFDLTVDNVQPLVLPKGAPARYQLGRLVEVSDYASWSELSNLMDPLYTRAATLPAQGPLAAELKRIQGLSSEPIIRAEAALALVQDRIRYVALAMGAGGLVPADAAETWARRYGDCKGKTALLLALLHAMNIEAEPVLVSTVLGDGLDARLPMVGLFDHVLVRATINGRTYWLDGTRTGDTRLDRLTVPAFGWGLPVRAGASTLIRMLPQPLAVPTQAVIIRMDATAGLTVPAPTRIEMLTRGDEALGVNMGLASLTPDARDRALREYWRGRYDFIDVKTTGATYDAERGEHRLVMEGTARMDWSGDRYETDGTGVGYKADFTRSPGPGSEAPFAVPYPIFATLTQKILLPRGSGFKVDGAAEIDQTVAGIHYRRHATIKEDVFFVERSERSVASEFPATEAGAGQAALRVLASKTLYLDVPASYRRTKAEIAAALSVTPTTTDGFVDRGFTYLDTSRYDESIADFTQAIALDPKNGLAFANRGIARVWKDEPGAAADLDAAAALEPRNAVVYRGRGLLAERKGAWPEAIAAYSKSLDLEPGNSFALEHRASAYRATGDDAGMLADTAALLKLQPGNVDLRLMRANVLRSAGRTEDALAEAVAVIAESPTDPYAHVVAGKIYGVYGRRVEAMAAFDRALANKPEDYIYLNRADVRAKDDLAGRRADVEAALRLSPTMPEALEAKAKLQQQAGDRVGAIRTWSAALASEPNDPRLLTGRGIAHLQAGNLAAAEKDFAAARAHVGSGAKAATLLNNMCWAKATAGVGLQSALADCDAALTTAPDAAGFIDSRALVLLRLGRVDEAIAAYSRALAKQPDQPSSLYGRAAAWARKGDATRSAADAKAAIRINPDVRDQFERYGIKL